MLETARMQGWNVLETLEAGPAAASTKLKTSWPGASGFTPPEFRPKNAERSRDGRIST
ncbi:MAG: hypothetical protein OXC26_24455 [Albidovulum sp.]|nr:hypothetical protein [Albidovulum sp.]